MMTFSEALKLLQKKQRMRRTIWKPYQYIYCPGDINSYLCSTTGAEQRTPLIYMKRDRVYKMPWLPQHIDFFAIDWEVAQCVE